MQNHLPTSNDPPITSPAKSVDQARPFENALGISKTRLGMAIAIAAASDVAAALLTLAPPLMWGLDLVTAVALFVVLGWRWPLLVGLVLEAIPGVGMIPFWLLVVAAIAVWGTARPKLNARR